MTDDQKEKSGQLTMSHFQTQKKRQVILICIYIYTLVYADLYLYVQ